MIDNAFLLATMELIGNIESCLFLPLGEDQKVVLRHWI